MPSGNPGFKPLPRGDGLLDVNDRPLALATDPAFGLCHGTFGLESIFMKQFRPKFTDNNFKGLK
jgi:hypothetical protein